MSTIIFHIDVNSAFLSWSAVKQLQEGSEVDLRTIPSIIGGDSKTRHGIVTAKSIPAKKYGIQTAEPVASAMRKCPNLTVVSPDMIFYRKMSHALMDYLRSLTPDIEQLSVDECFMDFGPISHRYPSPEEGARIIKDSIREMFGFTVNIGISTNRLLAKMASDFEKPDKVHTLYPQEVPSKMWPLDVGDLYMVGKSSASRLRSLGIRTIGDLANTPAEFLEAHFKNHGIDMWRHANGISDDRVEPVHPQAKGIGNSTTMPRDAVTLEDALPVLRRLSDQVAYRLREAAKLAGTVTVEIKYSDFVSCSRQDALYSPSASGEVLYEKAVSLYRQLWNGSPVRLLGIRCTKLSDLSDPVQMTLFDYDLPIPYVSPTHPDSISHSRASDSRITEKPTGASSTPISSPSRQKLDRLDKALDSIRDKYGKNAIVRGSDKSHLSSAKKLPGQDL